MRELVEYLCRSLVEHPEQVTVTELEEEAGIVLEIRTASEDAGRVIGRQGRIIAAIRTLTRAAGQREGKRILVRLPE